jgi:hypothetical protein
LQKKIPEWPKSKWELALEELIGAVTLFFKRLAKRPKDIMDLIERISWILLTIVIIWRATSR